LNDGEVVFPVDEDIAGEGRVGIARSAVHDHHDRVAAVRAIDDHPLLDAAD